MEIKKLDKRMKGYGYFNRCLDFRKKESEKFIEIRKWCWETWGPSCEYEFWQSSNTKNPSWSWIIDDWRIRIYLATDKEIQWFHLKWG